MATATAGRIQRFDKQSQLRRSAGQGWTNLPREPAYCRCDRYHGSRDRRPHDARKELTAMEKFTKFSSRLAPLPIDNIDTDQIIPARFLKTISKAGLGDNLFSDWRYSADGTPKPDFVLNQPRGHAGGLLAGGKLRCRRFPGQAPLGLVPHCLPA